MSCARSIPLSRLASYFDGELAAQESDAFEEHLMTCDDCSERVTAIAQIASGTRRLAKTVGLPFILTASLRERLAKDSPRAREYTLDPGGTVPCSASADDQLVILRLNADLSGVRTARVELADDDGLLSVVHEDIPLDGARSDISIAYPGPMIRALPDLVVHVRLSAGDDEQARCIAEYTLQHTHGGS